MLRHVLDDAGAGGAEVVVDVDFSVVVVVAVPVAAVAGLAAAVVGDSSAAPAVAFSRLVSISFSLQPRTDFWAADLRVLLLSLSTLRLLLTLLVSLRPAFSCCSRCNSNNGI